MGKILAGAACAMLLPCLALAQSLPAGFAPGSIWLSETNITAGDTVHIFTVVYNSSAQSINGDVAFSVDGSVVGTASFDLAAGASDVESQQWAATAGSHSFQATAENTRDDTSKQPVAIADATTASISATVAAPPPPTPTQQALDTLETVVASSTPTVETVAQTIYGDVDGIRQQGLDYLNSQVASSTVGTPQVLGTSTEKFAPAATAQNPSLWQRIAAWLLVIFGSPILFFVLFILLALFLLWLLWRGVRRFAIRRPNRY